MTRITREQLWMNIAEVAAMRSTCYRGNVGALIVKNRDVVSIGYNGPPSGEPHCMGNNCPLNGTSCSRSVHAEENAIHKAMEKMVEPLSGCDLYCTYSPCLSCAKLIRMSGVGRLFYRHSYRLSEGLDWLMEQGPTHTGIYKVTPSGFLIGYRTGAIIESA